VVYAVQLDAQLLSITRPDCLSQISQHQSAGSASSRTLTYSSLVLVMPGRHCTGDARAAGRHPRDCARKIARSARFERVPTRDLCPGVPGMRVSLRQRCLDSCRAGVPVRREIRRMLSASRGTADAAWEYGL
jgi:hypothetical protein